MNEKYSISIKGKAELPEFYGILQAVIDELRSGKNVILNTTGVTEGTKLSIKISKRYSEEETADSCRKNRTKSR